MPSRLVLSKDETKEKNTMYSRAARRRWRRPTSASPSAGSQRASHSTQWISATGSTRTSRVESRIGSQLRDPWARSSWQSRARIWKKQATALAAEWIARSTCQLPRMPAQQAAETTTERWPAGNDHEAPGSAVQLDLRFGPPHAHSSLTRCQGVGVATAFARRNGRSVRSARERARSAGSAHAAVVGARVGASYASFDGRGWQQLAAVAVSSLPLRATIASPSRLFKRQANVAQALRPWPKGPTGGAEARA